MDLKGGWRCNKNHDDHKNEKGSRKSKHLLFRSEIRLIGMIANVKNDVLACLIKVLGRHVSQGPHVMPPGGRPDEVFAQGRECKPPFWRFFGHTWDCGTWDHPGSGS